MGYKVITKNNLWKHRDTLDTQSTEGYTGLLMDTQGYRWIHRVMGEYTGLRVDAQGYG